MKYASQIFGDALAWPTKASSKKLSSLEPGQIVRTVDGSTYRVRSKTASPKGIAYKLADLQGDRKSVV
jgi:endonuclease YncB( thermonuclease family)